MTPVRSSQEITIQEAELLAAIDLDRLPDHIAIIMDGNGRWAKGKHLPRIAGHRAGMDAVRETVKACARLGISFLTLYAFSLENWKRPRAEVRFLMSLLREYLKETIDDLNENNIRLDRIGRINELSKVVQKDLEEAVKQTSKNDGMRLTLALNYGSRAEIVDATKELLKRCSHDEELCIDEEVISRSLYTRNLPDPDLLIRTSGELRLSNFLLWQVAYSEIWVTSKFWPDFEQSDLLKAVIDFQKRDRRYGGLG